MILYHGTSMKNADEIMKNGFKDRIGSGRKNWDGLGLSQKGFVYLTRAYPFFYAMQAAEDKDEFASVLRVEADNRDLYPDEDFLRQAFKKEKRYDIKKFKLYGVNSLTYLGNVAIEPRNIIKIIGRKDFEPKVMWGYSDPSMTVLNYQILGEYYRALTDKWWNDEDWKSLQTIDFIKKLGNG